MSWNRKITFVSQLFNIINFLKYGHSFFMVRNFNIIHISPPLHAATAQSESWLPLITEV